MQPKPDDVPFIGQLRGLVFGDIFPLFSEKFTRKSNKRSSSRFARRLRAGQPCPKLFYRRFRIVNSSGKKLYRVNCVDNEVKKNIKVRYIRICLPFGLSVHASVLLCLTDSGACRTRGKWNLCLRTRATEARHDLQGMRFFREGFRRAP